MRYKMKIIIVILLSLFSSKLFAIEPEFRTGNLKTDFLFYSELNGSKELSTNDKSSNYKSPILAGTLSALIPGAGEVYTGNYLKAALFLAIEGVTIYLNHLYTKKGNDQTVYFQNYADEYWSVVRYAQWLNQWASSLGGSANIHIDPNENLKPWYRVNWNELNQAERSIKEFSHTLYPHGHQQYYELIGKYPQYSQGWDDSKFAKGTYSVAGEYYYDTKGKFIYYSELRGKANDYYNIADKALIVTISNHIISMIDAIISANQHNSKISMSAKLNQINFGGMIEYYPEINLKLRF